MFIVNVTQVWVQVCASSPRVMMLCIYKRYWSVRSTDPTSYRPRAIIVSTRYTWRLCRPSRRNSFKHLKNIRRILALKESGKAPRSRNLWVYTLSGNLDSRLRVRAAQVCMRVCCVGQGLSFLCFNVICWHLSLIHRLNSIGKRGSPCFTPASLKN